MKLLIKGIEFTFANLIKYEKTGTVYDIKYVFSV